MVQKRCFLAFALPTSLAEEVTRVRQSFVSRGVQGRWVHEKKMHVTLHFFGALSEDEIDRAKQSVKPVLLQVPSIDVKLKAVGVFPDARRPRVLWVGLDARAHALQNLHRELTGALRAAGFPVESRNFHAHVTLARFTANVPPSAKREIQRLAGFVGGATCRIQEVLLFESVLSKEGSEYHALIRFPVGSNTPV